MPSNDHVEKPGPVPRSDEPTTHFGYQSVPETEKAGLVRDVFSSVAERYDLMNDLMSFGIHRLWKAEMIKALRPKADMHLLDVGGGTGDIAFRFLEAGGGAVTVCDINADMLRVGRDRAADQGLVGDRARDALDWTAGDAENLPFENARFDAYTTAFCIRNVTHPENALTEAHRVMQPGSRFFCLEFSKVTLAPLEAAYDAYSFKILPALGEQVAGDRASYQYLAESIRRFPDQETFAAMMRDAGFEGVKVRNLSGGIVALHSGWRI